MSKHTCLHYDSEKSLLELIVPYFEQGFRNNELCIWVVPQSLGVERARDFLLGAIKDFTKYLNKGQFELYSHEDFYLQSGKFDIDRVLNIWAGKVKQAAKLGFKGVCASGDSSWVPENEWETLINYENKVNEAIDKHNITALCTYSAEKYDLSKLFTLSFSHELTLRGKDGKMDILINRNMSNIK